MATPTSRSARFHLHVLVALVLGALPALGAAAAADAEPPPAKPNLVIVLADDLGYGDLGCFGSKLNRTPNLDRMSREGMRLTSFYAEPICTPARAELLTGCYPKRVSMPDNLWPVGRLGLSGREHTIATLLKQQGYATTCVGKWHLGDQPNFLPTRRGFDHFFGLPYPNNMFGDWDGAADVPSNQRRPPLPLLRDQEVIETISPERQDQLTRRYTDEAIAFIKAHRDAPFFLYYALDEVHVPLYPGPAFKGKSRNGAYGDSVEELDASVGELTAALRELHLERNTLVVFTSDNGPGGMPKGSIASAGPLRGGKGTTFEGGMREPTIAWWPDRIAAGSQCDAIAGVMDLLPTFVALGGGVVPDDHKIDGADLSPVLLGKAEHSSREVQYYFQINTLDAVRRGRWKLAIATQKERMKDRTPPAKADFHPRLYDLVDDIGERHDVAAEHPDIVTDLQKLAQAIDGDLGLTAVGPGVRPPDEVPDPKPLLKKR